MITREKFIFWILLPVLAAVIIIGIDIQKKKRQSSEEFLKDIGTVAEKVKTKKKTAEDSWDIEGLKKKDTLEDYPALMERSIFFRPVSEAREESGKEIISLKEEEPAKPVFVYKGRMMLGAKVIVIIEDKNTGKSFSVKEGDVTAGFTVLSIGEKEIRLRKNDGEEVLIPTVKEEKRQEEPEGLK